MLRVGLTGGIGSGKSTVAQRFRELGALVIDADQLAREVVAVGSTGLAAIRERFGEAVLGADGSLDRAALGEIVFGDPKARQDLESITHPLIRARTRSLMKSAPAGKIVVHDVPLLVELDMGAAYHLTVVVGADEDSRIARLTGKRALSEVDARARIAAQATDHDRRAAADAWLDNNGTVQELQAQVDALWQERMLGFNENLMTGSRSDRLQIPTLVPYDDSWPAAAARLSQRATVALGARAVAVEHIGSTSVPGLTAKEVIDLEIAVPRLSDADSPEFVKALADKGFPRAEGNSQDPVQPWAPDQAAWAKRLHGSADPGRAARLHVREHGSPGWVSALLLRDWLVANPAERDQYGELKRELAQTQPTSADYTVAKEQWVGQALERARTWARHTGWSGS
jgi:dephospho-CoA kinase